MTALMGLDTRLRLARLYLCTDTRARQGDLRDFLDEALMGGVDIVQIREKNLDPDAELAALEVAREAARRFQAIVCVNDQPALAERFGADMLHLGQTDGPSGRARAHLHRWALIGRSTHTTAQVDAVLPDRDSDYFCVGPVYPTPTKPDYPAAGLDLVRHAARVAPVTDIAAKPWFAIGGIDRTNLDSVIAAGARRVCVVRAITESSDPQAAAQELWGRLGEVWREDKAMEQYSIAAIAGLGQAR